MLQKKLLKCIIIPIVLLTCLSDFSQTIFAKGAHYAIKDLSQIGYDVVSLDWTMSAKDARYLEHFLTVVHLRMTRTMK